VIAFLLYEKDGGLFYTMEGTEKKVKWRHFACALLGPALLGPALLGPALLGPALLGPALHNPTPLPKKN
jgi:hypothetical protein